VRNTPRAIRASVAAVLVSAGLLTSWLALPQSAAACSCLTGSIVEFAKLDDTVVFSGLVGPKDPIGLQVAVDRWFAGRGVVALVHLDPAYLDRDSAGCGVPAPPAGTRWLFGGSRQPGSDLISVSACSPHGDLSTPEGQRLLADAAAAFAVIPIPRATDGAPTPPLALPASPAVPSAPVTNEPLATVAGVVPFLAIGVSAVLGAGLVVLVVAFARRRRAPD
jgi:hypothetical protein